MSAESGFRVVRRLLTAAQVSDYARLVDAGVALATEGGYDAVDMREVASRAGMSTAKAYQLVGTKDQLLLEALMSLGETTANHQRKNPPQEPTPGGRLRTVLRATMEQVGKRPLLYRALYHAYVASTPTLGEITGSGGFGPERASWILDAMLEGDTHGYSEESLTEIAGVVATLLLGAMVGVAAGRDIVEVIDVLDAGVARLLDE